MSLSWMIGIFVGLLLILLGSGIYIGIGLATVGILGLEFLAHLPGMIGNIMFNTLWSYVLAAIPLFLFMGEVVLHSGISQSLYRGISKWTRVIPGGLLHANIVSCAMFAAVSGSSVATAGTLGAVAYPEQMARRYSKAMVTGSLAAGGTLGILIPPSITMIIYGAFVGASVGQLFAGGVIPGIILALLFMGYILIKSVRTPAVAEPYESVTWHYLWDAITAFKEIWPVMVIMVTILGGIYGGIFTPTEAAAISCFEALILAAVFRKLNFTLLKKASLSALRTTSMVMFIMIGAKIFGQALSMLKIPAQLCDMLTSMEISALVAWLGVCIVYLILGCLMDGISLILLTLPVTYPLLIVHFGFDPIWFGVLLVLLLECGLITPPVGINVYVIHGISGGTNIGEIFKGIVPFFICMVILLVLLTFVPELVLWLPSIIFAR